MCETDADSEAIISDVVANLELGERLEVFPPLLSLPFSLTLPSLPHLPLPVALPPLRLELGPLKCS